MPLSLIYSWLVRGVSNACTRRRLNLITLEATRPDILTSLEVSKRDQREVLSRAASTVHLQTQASHLFYHLVLTFYLRHCPLRGGRRASASSGLPRPRRKAQHSTKTSQTQARFKRGASFKEKQDLMKCP